MVFPSLPRPSLSVLHASHCLEVLDIVPFTMLLSLYSHSQEDEWNRPHCFYVIMSHNAFQEHRELSEWKYWDILGGWVEGLQRENVNVKNQALNTDFPW